MYGSDVREEFYRVKNALLDDAYAKLDEAWIYESEAYRLGTSDIMEEVLIEQIKSIMSNEKLRTKIVNEVSKKVMSKKNQQEKEYKAEQAKGLKLWKASGGKIPCLCECGFYRKLTKKQVLEESNNFICAECSERIGTDGAVSVFAKKSVFTVFNIK